MSFRISYFTAALLGMLVGCSGSPGPEPAPTPSVRPAAPAPAAAAERPAPPPRASVPPAPADPAPGRTTLRAATVDQAMAQFLAHDRGSKDVRHVVERIDLNGDGRDDALVLLQSRRHCSARGCTLLVFERVGDAFELHSRLLLGRTPLIAAESHTGGWRDLVAPMTSATAGMRLMMVKHTARGYPDDPAQLAAVPPTREVRGRVLFSDD